MPRARARSSPLTGTSGSRCTSGSSGAGRAEALTSAGGRSCSRWGGGGSARRGRGRGGGGTSTAACRRRGRCGRLGTRAAWQWWASHQAAGISSRRRCTRGRGWPGPCVGPVRTAGRSGRGRGPRPCRPRTTGMIRAWQASRRACSAVIRSPVEVVAAPIPVSRVSRSRVTITLVVVPPWVGQAGVGEVLQERHERLPTAAGDRQCVDLTERGAARGGVGVQVGAEPVGDVVGDAGVEVGGPVTARSEVQPRRGLGPGLLGEQPLVLGLVGDLGSQVLEDTTAEVTQLPRPEHRGLFDQVRLGLDDQVVTQVVGQRVQRLHDHPRLGQVHVAGTQRVGRSGSTATRGRQPTPACRRTVPWLSRVWVANQAAVDRSPVASAMSSDGREHPEPFGLGAADQPRDPQQELLLLVSRCGTPD